MRNEVILYEKIYETLKNKIECGILPGGYRLPSRARMCKEFETSEKPVRCAIEMLAREGLVETEPRKCPTVAYHQNVVHKAAELSLQKASVTSADDALKTGVLLCYPVIRRGISLCRGADWDIAQTIAEHMNPRENTRFWRLSNRFWRFFVARNENKFILRIVDSMGYSDLHSLAGDCEVRSKYLSTVKEFIRTVREGGDPESVPFEDMSFVYGASGEKKETTAYRVPPDSVFLLGAGQLEKKICKAEERYSGVYLDIIGSIFMGYYRRGDQLPSHKEMQKIYGVSIDTTLKAVKILKGWGVVDTAPRKGIWVAMDTEELKQVPIDPMLVACHVRKFLDSLELLTLIIEGVTLHAMQHVGKDEAEKLRETLERRWNDSVLFHFFPSVLLEFITDNIQYEMLRSIFGILCKNFQIGRSVPKLIGRDKTDEDIVNYTKCLAAMDYLEGGDIHGFAEEITGLFQDIRNQITAACKKLGYWETSMQVYDGKNLWK